MRAGLVLRAATDRGGAELASLEEAIRTPLPVSRRIAFASLSGGTGCSTVAARVAATLHTRRNGRVLGVDAQGASPSMAHHAALPADALPVVQLGESPWPDGIGRWRERTHGLHPGPDVTVTDWGALTPPRMQLVARHSHALCLVAPSERAHLQRALDWAAALRETHGTEVVIAAVDLRAPAAPATRVILSRMPVTTVRIPRDGRLGAIRPLPNTALRGASVLAFRRLAAALVTAAAGSRGAAATREEARS